MDLINSDISKHLLVNNSRGFSIFVPSKAFLFLFKYSIKAKNILLDFKILNNCRYFSRNSLTLSDSFPKNLIIKPNKNNKLFSRTIRILYPIDFKFISLFFISEIISFRFSKICSFSIFFLVKCFIVFWINFKI